MQEPEVQIDDTDNSPIEPIEIGINKAKEACIKNQIGEYATPIDNSPKSSDLQIGNLQDGDSKNLMKYGKLVARDT